MPPERLPGHRRVHGCGTLPRLVVLLVGAAVGIAGVPLATCVGVGIAADAQDDPPVGAPERDVALEDACELDEEGTERDCGGGDPPAAATACPAEGVDARFFRRRGGPVVACSGPRDLSIRGPPIAA